MVSAKPVLLRIGFVKFGVGASCSSYVLAPEALCHFKSGLVDILVDLFEGETKFGAEGEEPDVIKLQAEDQELDPLLLFARTRQ